MIKLDPKNEYDPANPISTMSTLSIVMTLKAVLQAHVDGNPLLIAEVLDVMISHRGKSPHDISEIMKRVASIAGDMDLYEEDDVYELKHSRAKA